MKLAGVRLGPLPVGELDALLDDARAAEVSYGHTGSTLDPDRWPDRRARTYRGELGQGIHDYAAAVGRLRAWAPQRSIGATVHPPQPPIEPGTTLLVVLRLGLFRVVAPNRIIETVVEDRRFGFAYGTLPGHAERGEESFLIELGDDGTVTATVRVDAEPATLAARIGSPLVRCLQRVAIRRYLGSLAV